MGLEKLEKERKTNVKVELHQKKENWHRTKDQRTPRAHERPNSIEYGLLVSRMAPHYNKNTSKARADSLSHVRSSTILSPYITYVTTHAVMKSTSGTEVLPFLEEDLLYIRRFVLHV